jgi:hypothetical protein
MSINKTKVLLAINADWQDDLIGILVESNFEIIKADSNANALDLAQTHDVNATIIEQDWLQKELSQWLHQERLPLLMVVKGGFGDAHNSLLTYKLYDWVTVPFSKDEFLTRLGKLIAKVESNKL